MLIPKVASVKVSDFCPISLSNSVDNIVTKVIENWLKFVLPSMIGDACAFVPGQLITNNVITTFELMHFMRKKTRGRKDGWCCNSIWVKYMIEWNVTYSIRLGFVDHWVRFVMDCVSSSKFSFVLNKIVKGYVFPSRGLRQRCPFSSYLFCYVLKDYLSRFGLVKILYFVNFSCIINGPKVNYLFFADEAHCLLGLYFMRLLYWRTF